MTVEKQAKEYLEKLLISDLLIRYFSSIDDKQFDINFIEKTFTNDARIIRPNGVETVGHDSILSTNEKSFARFKATQHVTTDYIIDITGDAATVRANLTGMHLWADNEHNPTLNNKHFYAGIVLTAKVIKVSSNWRISELKYRSIWRTGDGMSEMAKSELPKN